MRRTLFAAIAVLALTGAAPALSPNGSAGVAPPNASTYGQSLAGWLGGYWRWYQAGGSAATEPFRPGPAPVVYMPLPQGEYQGGMGTSADPAIFVGGLDVTLAAGESFVLPVFGWVWERYNTGQIEDPNIPEAFIRSTAVGLNGTGLPQVTIDGRPVLQDFWSYYPGPQAFDPILVYAEPTSYGSIAALRYQSVGFVSTPLTPGAHTVHLVVRLGVTNAQDPQYPLPVDVGIVYNNTWTIQVR